MGEIERVPNSSGEIEVFGASQHLIDELDSNFADRGKQAATLLVATLTETPYVYEEDGTQFAIPVSNRYQGMGDNEAATKDTVDIACEALAEFVRAKVPGTKRVHLGAYPTKYRQIWGDLRPSWRTPRHASDSFEEAFVEAARAQNVNIASPDQGERIIRTAPSTITGLRLSDRYSSFGAERHKLVTTDGHVMTVCSDETLLGWPIRFFLSSNLSWRGGTAPSSGIARDIEQRVVALRTKHSSR